MDGLRCLKQSLSLLGALQRQPRVRDPMGSNSSLDGSSGLGWSRGPHFPRAGVPQDQSPEYSEGYGYGRFSRTRPSAQPEWRPRLTFDFLPRPSMFCWWYGDRIEVSARLRKPTLSSDRCMVAHNSTG